MPKQIDLDAQRLVIANAAIRVIGEAGLEGARLRDVARAAQLTTGAVTHYFDGKDEVLLAALEEIVRRILDWETSFDASLNLKPSEAFFELACAILPLDHQSRTEWRVWLAFWGRAIGDERLRKVHQDYYARMASQLAEALSQIGGMPPERANQTADAVMAALDGVGVRVTLEPELWPAARQRETLATLINPLLAVLDAPTASPL